MNYNKELKKIVLLLLFSGGTIGISTAQAKFKVGDRPFTIEKCAVLEVESEDGGFLPPHMLKTERDAIFSPTVPTVAGLMVWCTDCNRSINLPNGELCVYQGNSWVSLPFAMASTSGLSTGKITDANKPVRSSSTSATISGTLKEVFGPPPVETGIVYREIINDDFAVLPVLDAAGNAVVPVGKKATGTPVTTAGAISAEVTGLSSVNPYYFRTYTKSDLGISYGNPVIFNTAAPAPSIAVVINTVPLAPVFTGTLTVNAGTPVDTVTEYGYCSSTAKTTPTTATDDTVILSTPEALAALNEQLNKETFTTNPKIPLTVTDYKVKAIAKTYFIFYVKTDAGTSYSPVATSFTPVADPVTGGTAVAKVTAIDHITKPVMAGENSTSSITVHFNVTKEGSYDFKPVLQTGATTGLTMSAANGNFTVGEQAVTFQISGLPKKSLDGNVFVVSAGIGGLSTGAIQLDKTRLGNITDGNAYCDDSHTTAVVPVFSTETGRVWMDRNLGASQAATSATDYLAYGCLYQWGRGNDGHASIGWTSATSGTPVNGTTETKFTKNPPDSALFVTTVNTTPLYTRTSDWLSPSNNNLWQNVNGVNINNPCPAGYRVPTKVEFNDEATAYSLSENDVTTNYNSFLKLTAAGYRPRWSGSILSTVGLGNLYWKATLVESVDDPLWKAIDEGVLIPAAAISMPHRFIEGADSRINGESVRCIKN